MSRVQIGAADNLLRVGLGILLALMLGMSTWLTQLILLWTRHVREIESELARGDGDTMPPLTRTGERELDRIIDALNEALARLSAARRESESLAAEVALAERLAGLGRVAAGVAHEIRNPIAVMRLRAENALAGDDARRCQALADVLEQVSRLDALVAELLAMTQRREPHPIVVELQQFLADRVRVHRDEAALRNIALVTETAIARVRIDPEMIGRILDNLMSNAIWHTPVDGKVIVQAKPSGRDVRFTVADTGAGVDSELRDRSFEPFVTGRLDGTGLGLAIARELADAHGGSLVLLHPGGETPGQGAVFALDLPGAMSCQPS
jgi:signal transduction histidine kinase